MARRARVNGIALGVGERIKSIRLGVGLSQWEATRRAGCRSVSQWQCWEAGRTMPRLAQAFRIADALGVSLDALRPRSGANRASLRWLEWFGRLPGFYQGQAFDRGALLSGRLPKGCNRDRMTWRIDQLHRAGILEYCGADLYRLNISHHKPPPLPVVR